MELVPLFPEPKPVKWIAVYFCDYFLCNRKGASGQF